MLCYSTASLPDRFTARDIAEALLPSPFRGVEVALRPDELARASEASYWLGYRTELEARGLRVTNVQLGHPFLLGPVPHSPGLSSLDPAGRLRRVDAVVAAFRVAVALGSPLLTVTTGLPEREGDVAAQEALFHDSLRRILAARPAAARHVKVAIEQEPEHVIHRAGQVLALCHAFEGEVFSNYDVGHGVVAGEDPAAAVRLLGPYLKNLHLEDIQGRTHRHLMFGDGDIDFRALFRALRANRYAGHLTMDLYPFKDAWERAVRDAGHFLRDVAGRFD